VSEFISFVRPAIGMNVDVSECMLERSI